MSPANCIRVLERREQWLTHRIDDYYGHDDSHDRAERTAFRWALSIVKDHTS